MKKRRYCKGSVWPALLAILLPVVIFGGLTVLAVYFVFSAVDEGVTEQAKYSEAKQMAEDVAVAIRCYYQDEAEQNKPPPSLWVGGPNQPHNLGFRKGVDLIGKYFNGENIRVEIHSTKPLAFIITAKISNSDTKEYTLNEKGVFEVIDTIPGGIYGETLIKIEFSELSQESVW